MENESAASMRPYFIIVVSIVMDLQDVCRDEIIGPGREVPEVARLMPTGTSRMVLSVDLVNPYMSTWEIRM